MSRRVFFIIFYVIAFFMALYAGSNAYSQWDKISDWGRATVVMSIILGFCGILLAYWAYVDDERIYELERKLRESYSS